MSALPPWSSVDGFVFCEGSTVRKAVVCGTDWQIQVVAGVYSATAPSSRLSEGEAAWAGGGLPGGGAACAAPSPFGGAASAAPTPWRAARAAPSGEGAACAEPLSGGAACSAPPGDGALCAAPPSRGAHPKLRPTWATTWWGRAVRTAPDVEASEEAAVLAAPEATRTTLAGVRPASSPSGSRGEGTSPSLRTGPSSPS